MAISFAHTYAQLPEHFFYRQAPTPVPNPQLIQVNLPLAQELGIDSDWIKSPEGLAMLSGNQLPASCDPLALAYAGHQFGGFVPRLGDGRALLLGELKGRDIQLKGSGRTPFSRGGDGKSALGPVLREYLVSEAMFALGVPTTRALAAVTTGERILRQEGEVSGGILTRVAASHIRVGTFQYFAAQDDQEAVQILADYSIKRHYPKAESYLELLESVISAQALLIAHWMSLGFIHGVMNTDNFSISGETIDYGPCAFMDEFHPECVFSSIDRGSRYAWSKQAQIAHWNLTRFAETLLPLLAPTPDEAIPIAEEALKQFGPQFRSHYQTRFRAKLGLPHDAPPAFIEETLGVLANQQLDFTLFFRELTKLAGDRETSFFNSLEEWVKKWRQLSQPDLAEMQAHNPILIPRNHRIEEAIQAAERGDYTPFHRFSKAWQNPYSESPDSADLEKPPLPEEKVQQTFCGT